MDLDGFIQPIEQLFFHRFVGPRAVIVVLQVPVFPDYRPTGLQINAQPMPRFNLTDIPKHRLAPQGPAAEHVIGQRLVVQRSRNVRILEEYYDILKQGMLPTARGIVLDRDDIQVTMKGAAKINRLILLGTPSLGSANTIRGLVEGESIVRTVQPETLATMASAYELLPHGMRKPLIGIDGRPLRLRPADPSSPDVDLFDPAAWRTLQWSVYDPVVGQRVVDAGRVLQRILRVQLGEFVDEVIEPRHTRKKIVAGLEMTRGKRDQNLPKKHGNIPL